MVRIPIKAGISEYYLPQNVEWARRKVDKMIICAPSVACTDPMDGVTPILLASDMQDCYLSLYDTENRELARDLLWTQIAHTNNNPLAINTKLNLSLCRIYFTNAPAADATLLLYVFYGTQVEDYCELPKRSVTVEFPLAADQEISFRDIINYYIHAIPSPVRGMQVWSESDPAWITLRDHDLTYQMANIHSEMARSGMNDGQADNSQANIFLLNNLDIDFDYSRIREAAGQASTQKITFLY